MLGRTLGLFFLPVLLLVPGCEAGGGGMDSGGGGMDAGTDSGGGGMDAGVETCETTADCDDGFPCTLDMCVVGGVCDHDPLHALCDMAAGEACVPGRGCVPGTPDYCTTDVGCDDGLRCNGVETCIIERGVCLSGTAIDCDDGNDCTADSCSETGGMCQYVSLCDAGPPGDAGPTCGPFDASMHYSGAWRVAPNVACDPGGGGGYSIGNATFSVSGGTLTVNMGSFTLTQSPAPTGPDFDVSGSNGCASVRLVGTMECEARFSAMWTANHSGSCAVCLTTSMTVAGRK